MSPRRLLVLALAAALAAGCNASGPTATAQATPPPHEPLPEAPPAAPVEVAVAEALAESPAAEVATEVTPASFATTQATTGPAHQPPAIIAESEGKLSPPAPPKTAAELFDAQVLALVGNGPPPDTDTDTDTDLAREDRDLIAGVIDSLTRFRAALRSDDLRHVKVQPLLDLSETIRAQIPLSLPTLALCRSVTQFGVYDAYDPPRFTAGRETPLVIYCEVDHFRSTPTPDQRWETRLTYEAVLYNDGQAAVAVVNKKPQQIVDRCRNRRRDFFLADRMTLPANLPVGKYVLKVTVIDQSANLIAEKTVPVLVAPN